MGGSCRLCGGMLYRDPGFEVPEPVGYGRIGPTWNSEGLTRARDSALLCPACVWGYSKGRPRDGAVGRVYAIGGKLALPGWGEVAAFLRNPEVVQPPFVVTVAGGRAPQPYRAVVNWVCDPVGLLFGGRLVWVSPPVWARAYDALLASVLAGKSARVADGLVGRLLHSCVWQCVRAERRAAVAAKTKGKKEAKR